MTAATYTSDLLDLFMFETTSNVTAFGGGGAGLSASVDFAMEGTNAVDKAVSGVAVWKGFEWANTANFTIGTDDHFFGWIACATPGISAGLSYIIGDDVNTNIKTFDIRRNDYGGNANNSGAPARDLGGEPYAIWFTNVADDGRPGVYGGLGSPSTTPDHIGVLMGSIATAKAPNIAMDGARLGTGYDILGGTGADDPANFAGIASDDESTSEGVFQTSDAGYIWQGKLRIGDSSNACEFEDSNTFVGVRKTTHAKDDFSEIIVEHASSILTLENVYFRGGWPAERWNRGNIEMLTDTATVNFTSCVFQDFGTTNLGSGATCLNCSWIDAAAITAAGADLTGSLIRDYEETVNTSPLIWDVATDPGGLLDAMTISKGTISAHAIEFGTTSPLTMNLADMAFNGYNTANSQTDSTFHIKRTTGNVVINLAGCSGNFSYISEGANVSLIVDPVTTTITVKDITTGSGIETARVALVAADATGDLNYEESVTITSSGTTATVTHTAHGLEDDQWVLIEGANEEEYNGMYEITTVNATTYTYTMTESGDSPATGTITSTTGIFNNTTNAAGQVTDTRTFTTNQNVTGRVRKSSASPYYKTVPITAVIDKDIGLTLTVSMVSDE